MPLVFACREKLADRVSDDFCCRETEDAFSGRIPGNDGAAVVGIDDRIVGGLCDRLIALDAGTQGHFGLASGRDIGQR